MPRSRERILLSWSGGKDGAMALHELRRQGEYEVVGLVTALTECESRVTAHGTCRSLMEAQARALDLPIEFLPVPKGCCDKTYVDRLRDALTPHRDAGTTTVAFGDLYLDEIRDFREEVLEATGFGAHFPLWHRDTKELAYAIVQAKFRAVVTCVDELSLDPAFLGRAYDRQFLADLPLAVDPCGENGEFHTFVYDGPGFAAPVPMRVGARSVDGPFHRVDLSPGRTTAARRLAAR
jgi:uncharacterized protein (TIGR00290 family)